MKLASINSRPKIVFQSWFLITVVVFLLILAGLFFVFKSKISFFNSQSTMSSSDLIQEFSGSYYRGDGLGVNCNLEFMPDSTFTIRWVADGGGRADYSGTISVQNMKFVLEPDQNVSMPDICLNKTYIPIFWGDRKYLLPNDDDGMTNIIVSYFCKSVKEGWEPRTNIHGGAYLRKTDIDIHVTGSPTQFNGQLACP